MELFGPPNIEKLKAKQNVEGIIKALSNKKLADVRWQAANALGQLRDKRAVEPLIETLNDHNEYVRKCTAEALGRIGSERATETLIEALKDKDVDVRVAAANALGQIGDERATEPLIAALKDQDGNLRLSAADALGQIGDDRAIQPLIDLLNDQNHSARESAANNLEKLGWQADGGQTEAIKWIAKQQWNMCVEIGVPAVEPLIEVLKDKNPGVRKSVVDALGQIADSSVVEPLISAFRDKSRTVRRSAVDALALISKDLTVDALIEALKSNDELVRRNAVYTLGKIGDDRAMEPLFETLKDNRKEVKAEAASEIARLGIRSDKICVELVKKLADENEEVRLKSAKALWRLNAIDFAIRSIRDEYKNRVKMSKEGALCELIVLEETADYTSIFEKLLAENWPNCKISLLEDIKNLQSLKTTISELPKKFPVGHIPSELQSMLSRLSAEQLKTTQMQIPIICKKIGEVQMFLERVFDSSIHPLIVEKVVITNDFKVVIETTRKPTFIAPMFAVLNADGIEVLKNCINELEYISNRITEIS
jgi:HEAT repeat protein